MAGTTTTRKRAPKKAAKKNPLADEALSGVDLDAAVAELREVEARVVNDDGSINPVEIGKRGRTPNPMVTLFVLDGVEYQVPSKPSPALMQRWLRDVRKKGASAATAMLLDTMLGEEALDALAESTEVDEEDMLGIYTALTHLAFGRFAQAKDGETASDPS